MDISMDIHIHGKPVAACDGQTDGQTGGFTIASTALCKASYADAL